MSKFENVIGKLKEELINKEYNFYQLDNVMTDNGFYSELYGDIVPRCIDTNNIAYIYNDLESNIDYGVLIDFIVTIASGKDEATEATYVKIINISEL